MSPAVVWNNESIRALERASIRAFMKKHRQYLKGRVLDFGAGKQPYRDLVEGEYVPHEQGEPIPGTHFDAVMCNQVMQYLDDPAKYLSAFAVLTAPGGHLVMRYPTCWAEVEESDLWRFTKAGMTKLLKDAGFRVLVHERGAEIDLNGFKFPLGYGVVAQAG